MGVKAVPGELVDKRIIANFLSLSIIPLNVNHSVLK